MKRALVVFLLTSSCASNRALDPFTAAQAALRDGVNAGLLTTTNQGAVTIPVRYNPAECECPRWEVYAFGRWTRVFVDPEDAAPLQALQASSDPLAVGKLTGRFSESSRLSERNVRYPVFVAE